MMVDGSPNRGVTVANPTERREGSATSPQTQVVQENANAKEESESKIPQSTPATKLEGKASTSSVHSGRSRWLKLRTTVQLTGAITQSHKKHPLKREDSFLKRFSTRQVADTSIGEGAWFCHGEVNKDETKRKWWITILQSVINPDENFLFGWLWLMTVCILYNAWTLIVRQAFPELRTSIAVFWYTVDALSDFVFLLDVMVQFRTGYLEQGLMVCDAKKLACHYVRSRPFLLDVAALTPLDLLQLHFGQVPILRLPRFLKLYRAIRFYYMAESRTIYPNLWRVVNLVHILLLLAHWFGCFYYMLSELEEFQGEWAYPRMEGGNDTLTRKYLGSVYWSTLTLTTIGDLATPATNIQYLFTIVSYLIGVFIFATIVGQVGNVITNRNASRLEFERLLDGAKLYMRHHKVPRNMQRRVQRWYDYSWSRGRMQGGGDIHSALGSLPDKLKTELALHVNLKTLKKVSIFQECQPEFLHDLVLKMKAYIFTPGDLICRKGEVAREMFIIADGILEVISEMGKVLTQMKAGDFFGEIGILNLDGFNRRTADVRSVGYSELFSLSREDVLSAMKDYPEAQEILQTMGRKRLMEARLAASTGKKHEELNANRSPNSLKALRNRESIDAGSGPKPREMVKRLKHDVQSLRGLLRSKSIPVRKQEDEEEMELHSITSQKKSAPSDEDNVNERNSSLRRIMKMIRWKGDRQASQPIKGIVRRISRARRPSTTDSTKTTETSVSRRASRMVSEPPIEPIGAGLPLLERLKLLKERERQQAESNRSSNSHSEIQSNPPAYFSHNDNSGTIVGEGLPLLQRIKLLKEKEAAANRSFDAPTVKPTQEPRAELPLLKRVLLLKQEESSKSDGSVSTTTTVSSADEQPKKPFKKPNPFQQICRSMQPQRQNNCNIDEEPSVSSRRQSITSNEAAQESQSNKDNADPVSNETVKNESPHPHLLENAKTEFSLSIVREHSQSPPLQEEEVPSKESVSKVPQSENTEDKYKNDEDSSSPQVDEHAVRRKRLRRMMAVVEKTCESSDRPLDDEHVVTSKDASCQTEDLIAIASQEDTSKPESKAPMITKSSETCHSSDSDYKDEQHGQLLGDELYSPIEDLSPFDDGIQEYLLKIMKNVKQAMKTYVIERQSELEAKVTELEDELRRKETTIRKLHFLSKQGNMPLSPSAIPGDISSLDNTDISSPESDTEADLLCPTTLRNNILEEDPERPKLVRHRYSWPSRSPARSRKDRQEPSSRSFEEQEPMSGLDFQPDEIWRVEFPADGVPHVDADEEEDEDEMSSSSESAMEDTVMEPHDWEARMLVQEFEKNRRKSAEDVMLWNWMVNRRSLQDWRRLQRQNNDNRAKRKHSLVDARTLNSWTTGDGSFYIRDEPHFVSTEDLRGSTRPKRDQFRQFRKCKRTDSSVDASNQSKKDLKRHASLSDEPRLVRIDTHRWTSLDDTRTREIERHQTRQTSMENVERYTNNSEVTSGVLGWPSSPCLPTITEDDVSRPSNAPSIVSRSYSQDCLVTAHWSGTAATTEDGTCERHSESEHGEDSPLIPFAQCSDESVVISLPEYEALLDLDP